MSMTDPLRPGPARRLGLHHRSRHASIILRVYRPLSSAELGELQEWLACEAKAATYKVEIALYAPGEPRYSWSGEPPAPRRRWWYRRNR